MRRASIELSNLLDDKFNNVVKKRDSIRFNYSSSKIGEIEFYS